MPLQKSIVIGIASVAIAVAAASVYWASRSEPLVKSEEAAPAPDPSLVRMYSPVIGSSSAKVTVVEFLDPACEACRAFYPHVKKILSAHPRDVRLVIRYVPFHGEVSAEAIVILEAARKQDLFEPVLSALFDAQPVWAAHGAPDKSRAWEVAKAAGLDVERARAQTSIDDINALLQQETADLQTAGVRSTPTFFVNGQKLLRGDPGELSAVVTRELARTK